MSLGFSVHSNIRDYEVFIEELPDFIDTLAAYPQAYFAIDENVWNIYADGLLKNLPREQAMVFPIHEDRKNLISVQEIYNQLIEHSAKRNLTLISIGSGILQDITGFVASTIYRGINWIYVPTTLLSQADSCIGSKTSLNYGKYKNLIGTFFPPSRIHIYTPFLQSQLEADFFSGYGEVIKLHLMGGSGFYRQLIELSPAIKERQRDALLQAIRQSLQVKLSFMEDDEFDTGRRNLLNYGHDFGHALESTSNFVIPHGQAVIIGMLAANIIARQRELLDKEVEREIAKMLLLPSLMIFPDSDDMNADAMIGAMKRDKKRIGNEMALIMMVDGFNFIRINDLVEHEVTNTLCELKHILAR